MKSISSYHVKRSPTSTSLSTPGEAVTMSHVLNLLMSCLGAFVHPLRLNFVEYFKNSGYEGKGKTYKPLKK